jgi:hypothetical protein
MNPRTFPMNQVDLIGKLANLKEEHYRNTLVLSAIIDILVEKDILTTKELSEKAAKLDNNAIHQVSPLQ